MEAAINNKFQHCLKATDNILAIYILDSKFEFSNMLTKGSTRFILKLQTKYRINNKIDYVIYQAGITEKNIPIGFNGIDVEKMTNKYFNNSLNKICKDMNEDIISF